MQVRTRKRRHKNPDLLPMNPNDFNVGRTAEVGEDAALCRRSFLFLFVTCRLLGTVSCLHKKIEDSGLNSLGVLYRYMIKKTHHGNVGCGLQVTQKPPPTKLSTDVLEEVADQGEEMHGG